MTNQVKPKKKQKSRWKPEPRSFCTWKGSYLNLDEHVAMKNLIHTGDLENDIEISIKSIQAARKKALQVTRKKRKTI